MTIDPGHARRRRLAVLGGARGRVLDRAPETADQFVEMLPILGATAVMAGISVFFALVDAVRVPVAAAVCLAVFWATIIFVVDRFLTASLTSTRTVWKLVALAAPRVLMAGLIGVVIATPLVLRVFDADVTARVEQNIAAQSVANEQTLKESAQAERLARARDRVTELSVQAKTGRITGDDPVDPRVAAARDDVEALEGDVAEQRERTTDAVVLYKCERDGPQAVRDPPPDCTGRPGNGEAAEQYGRQMETEQGKLADLESALGAARQDLNRVEEVADADSTASAEEIKEQAAGALPAARADAAGAQRAYAGYEATLTESTENADGLLARLEALHQISVEKPVLGVAHATIAALFFLVELLPVLVKTLKAYGDPTHYETAEHEDSRTLIDLARIRHDEERFEVEAQSRLRTEVLQDMLDRERELGRRANAHVAGEMEAILDRALDEWSAQVRTTLQGPP